MTMTCPEPAAVSAPAGDPQLAAEMAAAARCATVLEDAGLGVAFDHAAPGDLAIAIERPPGEPLRRLSPAELLALVELTPAQVHAWAQRPELPIPGSAKR